MKAYLPLLLALLAALGVVACAPGEENEEEAVRLFFAKANAIDTDENGMLNIDGVHVEAVLVDEVRKNASEGCLVYFLEKPDLSPAYKMDWEDRGQFVMAVLEKAASNAQAEVIAHLTKKSARFKSFWIDNIIVLEEDPSALLSGLLSFKEITAIRALRKPFFYEPEKTTEQERNQTLAVESNIVHVGANQVWSMGYSGTGIVVANIDTGVRYTHQALAPHYRGNQGGSYDHNYNWWDPYGNYNYPYDGNGHGTHTMGTIVGDDATHTNQIGMAPGARWIACRGCSTYTCSDSALLECAQFIAAPWNLSKTGANPSRRPNVVNNSWGDCATSYDNWYQGVVDAWRAAGIYPVFSNGNASNCGYSSPPGCNTVGNPARYANVTSVGSTGQNNGQYATHSNWGPTDRSDFENPLGYASLKPQVLAPGVNIRSSVPTSDTSYEGGWNGTSMSAPHVTGLVALILQAGTCLVGDFVNTETIIVNTAMRIAYASGCGGEGAGNIPNHAAGWGEINAVAAVNAAVAHCSCSNECSQSGMRRCLDASHYTICGNYDSDPCLEWGEAISCASGQSCSDGVCLGSCYGCVPNECRAQ
jgi:subtilisin family serine protease